MSRQRRPFIRRWTFSVGRSTFVTLSSSGVKAPLVYRDRQAVPESRHGGADNRSDCRPRDLSRGWRIVNMASVKRSPPPRRFDRGEKPPNWEIAIAGDLTDKQNDLLERLLELPPRSRGTIYFDSC